MSAPDAARLRLAFGIRPHFFGKRGRTAAALHNVYLLRFVDGLATATLAFALPLMMYAATRNVAWSGASFALEWLPRLAAIPVGGSFVDRIGARRFFLVADAGRAGIALVTAAVVANAPHFWPVLLAAAMLAGMLGQGTFIAAERLGVEMVGEGDMQRAQAMQVSIDQLVQVLGPVVGGVLLAFGPASVLLGVTALLAASVACAQRLAMERRTDPTTARPSVISNLRIGASMVIRHRSLRHVVAGTALFNLLMALLLTLTPAIVEQRLHRTTADVSLLWTAAAAMSVLAVGVANWAARRAGITAVGFVAGLVACGACALAGSARSYWLYVVCLMVFLAMDASYAVFIRTARARIVPKAAYGSTVGIIVLLSLVPYPVGGALVALVPLQAAPRLVAGCAFGTALMSCWSFAAIARHGLHASEVAPAAAQPAA